MTTTDGTRIVPVNHDEHAAALSQRLFESLVPAMELLTVELGLRRGLYAGLQRLGSADSAELALECGIAGRYAQEWLEQQATAGIVDVLLDGDASARRYGLSPAHADVLLSSESPYAMAGAAHFLVGMSHTFDSVVADFAHGAGVAYPEFGTAVRHAISSLNRPAFAHALGDWLEAMPDIDDRLHASPSVVIDAGCGTGWSTLALARRYPLADVIGIDLDAASIVEAQGNLADAQLGDRVRFVQADAGDGEVLRALAPDGAGLVTMFEALHDMNAPTRALAALGAALEHGGAILIADEKVADEFTAHGDLIERLNYGFSVLHCLPATVAEGGGEANGTVMRAPTVARWIAEAGLGSAQPLDIDNELWRFYRVEAR